MKERKEPLLFKRNKETIEDAPVGLGFAIGFIIIGFYHLFKNLAMFNL